MIKGALISDCEDYRYKLWRIWDETQPLVLFIMLNPSKADAVQDDHTIRKCIGFAKRWGYGGFYVGNLFGWRATDPEELYFKERHGVDIIGPDNDIAIKEMAASCLSVVLAWGNDGGLKGRNADIISMFPCARRFKKTKAKHPSHPLMLAYTEPLFELAEGGQS